MTSLVFFLIVLGVVLSEPSPQFLPVAVQMEEPNYRAKIPYSLKGLIQVSGDDNFKKTDKVPISTFTSTLAPSPLSASSISPSINLKQKSQLLKKRRRNKSKDKSDTTKIILNQNSQWMLKTINDKPAAEVLINDKASAARDLKDSTESSLVKVKKLEKN